MSGPGFPLEPFMGNFSLFCSFLEIPQFGLLSYVCSLKLSSGHLGPVLTLSTDYAAHTSMFSRCLLVGEASVWHTSPLAIAVRHLFCIFFFPSWLCCHLRFQSSPRTCLWEVFLLCGNSSFWTPSSGWISISNSFVLLFVFYILSYLLSKWMDCLSGCLVSSASVQKLFCGSCSAFKWFFDEFVRDKVVSLSYFPATLGNLLNFLFNTKCYLIQ